MTLKLLIDNEMISAQGDENLLTACLSAKLDVPYFCWHPAMGSVGSCRQCAVKIFRGPADATGQIVMACMTRLAPGMRVSINDPEATKFREAVVETVLTSHPHDCPVCEVAGECHLQDMTVLTGHATRRARHPKRTHRNQNLGPFIRHEMNRCIGCYRCVRFYRDTAGGEDFGVFGAAQNIYFGRAGDGALESNFAGNLVEVCPTGVFVDKPFSQNFRRKWDMRATPSVCPHCAVGCNITVNERGGEFRRVTNRFNATLNGYFLCDRGRFGTGFLNSKERLRLSRDRAGNTYSHAAARDKLTAVLREDDLIGIGSPRASVEANFALRELVGEANFYAGFSEFESAMLTAVLDIMRHIHLATLAEVEQADAVLILGDDPALVAPRLALALHQAATRAAAAWRAARDIPEWDAGAAAECTARIPFIIATTKPGWLDRVATQTIRTGVAEGLPPGAEAALRAAKRPLVVAGGDAATLASAANLALALRRAGVAAQLALLAPEANSVGLGLLNTRTLAQAQSAAAARHVLVLERDVLREPATGTALLASARSVTVLDHILTPTARAADLALSSASFAESDGTFINQEGRAQRYFKAIFGENDPPPAWALLRDAGLAAGRLANGQWETHADLLAAIATALPDLAPCALASPPVGGARPATLPHRHSGRTAAHAHLDVREPAPPKHADSPLGTTMEGPPIHQQHLAPVLWSPGWNSGQAINKQALAVEEVFLFEPSRPPLKRFECPTAPPDDRDLGAEELSNYAPAIIARRQAP